MFKFDPKKLYKLKNFGGFTLIVHPHKDDDTQQSVNIGDEFTTDLCCNNFVTQRRQAFVGDNLNVNKNIIIFDCRAHGGGGGGWG